MRLLAAGERLRRARLHLQLPEPYKTGDIISFNASRKPSETELEKEVMTLISTIKELAAMVVLSSSQFIDEDMAEKYNRHGLVSLTVSMFEDGAAQLKKGGNICELFR